MSWSTASKTFFLASVATFPLFFASSFMLASPMSSLASSVPRQGASISSANPNTRDDSKTSSLLSSKRTTSEELIPREVLFGNPENTSPLLSPDGKYLAYLSPSPDGVMNIFIRDLSLPNADKTTDRMITNEPKRAIRSLSWAYDSQTIL